MVKNKKLLALNVVLAVLVVASAVGLYARIEAANERYSILTPQVPAKDAPDYPAPEPARRVRAGDYLPIVNRMLFSSDRNPIIEVAGSLQASPESRPPLPAWLASWSSAKVRLRFCRPTLTLWPLRLKWERRSALLRSWERKGRRFFCSGGTKRLPPCLRNCGVLLVMSAAGERVRSRPAPGVRGDRPDRA